MTVTSVNRPCYISKVSRVSVHSFSCCISMLSFYLFFDLHTYLLTRLTLSPCFVLMCLSGLLCDLLWSDPDKDVQGWGENDRGVSFTFGADVVSKFLNRHDLDLICRAHQVVRKAINVESLGIKNMYRKHMATN